MSNVIHGLRTFELTEDGSEKVEYTYRRLGNIGATDAEWKGSRESVQGTYCQSEDALEYINLLLAYRDGHSVMGSGRECFVNEGYDGRCSLCKETDRLTGKDQHDSALDKMLALLRSKNNGL
jgi:hypothetical protein